MERPFCKSFVLKDGKISWFGPLKATHDGLPILVMGAGIFDRLSGELIGCSAVVSSISDMSQILESRKVDEDADLAIVRFSDGVILADSRQSPEESASLMTVWASGLIGQESFETLKKGLDFEQEWTPESLREQIRGNVIQSNGVTYTAHPLPVPPPEYDPDYRPTFIVIQAVSDAVFNDIEVLHNDVSSDAARTVGASIGIGATGLILGLLTVWFVSRLLTRPLLWMDGVAASLLVHDDNGEDLRDVIENYSDDQTITSKKHATQCKAPTTEVSQLVHEFRRMIVGFSGPGAAQVAESPTDELKNVFKWRSEYRHMYKGQIRRRTSYRIMSEVDSTTESDDSNTESNTSQSAARKVPKVKTPDPIIINKGRNILSSEAKSRVAKEQDFAVPSYRSKLFWWIFVLIVIPLLVTNILIVVLGTYRISDTLPCWFDDVEELSLRYEKDAITITAKTKANLTAVMLNAPVRNLHFYSRVANWLTFGGLSRSDAFTVVDEATEDCKSYSNDFSTCPFFDMNTTACDCEWEDPASNSTTCDSFDTPARNLQRRFFAAQKRDADQTTGERSEASSFGTYDYSPESTLWFDTVDELPGAEKTSNASGYATSYDRVRVMSALAVAEFPIYNHETSMGDVKTDLGSFVAFDMDGLFTGFQGCRFGWVEYSDFESSASNRAYLVDDALCPEGKHGYDPRCRSWYDDGRRRLRARGDPVHLTSPYLFASDDIVATSITSPLANNRTGEYVGQALIDIFLPDLQFVLKGLENVVSFMITPGEDVLGGDTVIGPDSGDQWKSVPISDLVLPFDPQTSNDYRKEFEDNVLEPMKRGDEGVSSFRRTNGTVESLTIAFAPVKERVLLPVDPSDFGRGALVKQELLYSIAVAKSDVVIRAPFERLEESMVDDMETLSRIIVPIIFFVTLLFTVLMFLITVEVTAPFIVMHRVLKAINEREHLDDIPPVHGGSTEVHKVYSSFAKLYKIIRMSNTAFFSGNLEWANGFLLDALHLFRRTGDRKSTGIACNNLGNIFYASVRGLNTVFDDENHLLDDSKETAAVERPCSAEDALVYLDEAVSIAEEDFDCAEDEAAKSEFAQQLADRVFNRGLFFLSMSGTTEEALVRAYEDLERVRDLDNDVRDYLLDRKLLLKNSAQYYGRLLRRIHGLADHYHDPALRQIWNVRDIVEDADNALFACWYEAHAPLFADISRVGRLQQLESAAVRLEMKAGNAEQAAKLAMRMLVEDEYILESAFINAAAACRLVAESGKGDGWLAEKAAVGLEKDIEELTSCISSRNVALDGLHSVTMEMF